MPALGKVKREPKGAEVAANIKERERERSPEQQIKSPLGWNQLKAKTTGKNKDEAFVELVEARKKARRDDFRARFSEQGQEQRKADKQGWLGFPFCCCFGGGGQERSDVSTAADNVETRNQMKAVKHDAAQTIQACSRGYAVRLDVTGIHRALDELEDPALGSAHPSSATLTDLENVDLEVSEERIGRARDTRRRDTAAGQVQGAMRGRQVRQKTRQVNELMEDLSGPSEQGAVAREKAKEKKRRQKDAAATITGGIKGQRVRGSVRQVNAVLDAISSQPSDGELPPPSPMMDGYIARRTSEGAAQEELAMASSKVKGAMQGRKARKETMELQKIKERLQKNSGLSNGGKGRKPGLCQHNIRESECAQCCNLQDTFTKHGVVSV